MPCVYATCGNPFYWIGAIVLGDRVSASSGAGMGGGF